MASKWINQLRKTEGAVDYSYDPFAAQNCIRSTSPGMNWLFGRNWGLPLGYSMLLWAQQKTGKSYLSSSFIAGMHRDFPDGICIKFNTEFRAGQLTLDMQRSLGIDPDRFQEKEVNRSKFIFDFITDEVDEMCKAGAPIKLLIIDSQNGLRGRREENQDSVEQHQMGDHAATMKVGLKRIIEVQRRHKISLIITSHTTPEMDIWEQKRGNKNKAAVAQGVLHHCEYFINLETNRNKAGQQDLLGRDMIDESKKGMDDKGEQTGRKVVAWMQDSSFGSTGRVAEVTYDFKQGVVNQHEEVYQLGTKWGIIGRPNNTTHVIGEQKFTGKPATLAALASDVALQKFVIDGLIAAEKNGTVMELAEDEVAAEFEKLQKDAA